ncbi:hypothetical protein Tco_1541056 [Tanacetum coccineum]
MASLDHRLNPLFSIKECMSCGALYTRNCGCSKGSLEDKILVPCLNEGWYTIHDENEILNTSESSNDNTNIVSAPQELFVFNQDPDENSSQSPPHIDHNCCYECGDSLDGIFCQQCTCKSYGKGTLYGYNCPPQIPIISNPEPCYNQNLNEILQNLQSLQQQCLSGPFNGGNCPSCSSVGSGNEFVYDPNPYSYNETPNFFNQPPQYQYETYSCEFCGGNSHPGYDCQTGNTPVFDQGPYYNQDFGFNQPLHYSPSQPQQFPYENYGVLHENFQCQPMNQNYDPNFCYNPIYFGFDQIQPQQSSTVQLLEIERINKEESFKKNDISIEEIMGEKRLIDDEINDITNDLSYKRFQGEKIDDEYERDCEIKIKLLQDYSGLDIEMRKKERILMEEKYLATSQRIKSICNDEDDSIPLRDIIARYSPSVAITSSPPVLPTEEPEDSLIMGDEHFDTIPEKESDELIKSSVENLVPIPSESEDFSDNESECDMPVCDDFTTFSNPLFDSNDDFTSSDDESLSDEDVPMENFKIYSNPLFDDEEIISTKIDPYSFNAESNLIESLLNRDTLIDFSPKFDFLLEEFSGELAHINPIPPGIEKADFDLEEEIRLVENLLYDNSSPRPPEELNLEIADTIFESLSPSPILVVDSDSLIEEIDLFPGPDDLTPPGVENDDSEDEDNSTFFPENESSILDPSSPRPPPEPPDVCLNFEPNTAMRNDFVKLNEDFNQGEMVLALNVEDVDSFTFVIWIFLPYLTYPEVSPLPSSTKNEDTIFDPDIST